jgi:hypothetical protein
VGGSDPIPATMTATALPDPECPTQGSAAPSGPDGPFSSAPRSRLGFPAAIPSCINTMSAIGAVDVTRRMVNRRTCDTVATRGCHRGRSLPRGSPTCGSARTESNSSARGRRASGLMRSAAPSYEPRTPERSILFRPPRAFPPPGTPETEHAARSDTSTRSTRCRPAGAGSTCRGATRHRADRASACSARGR